MTANEWIISEDTGISSITIWAVMTGTVAKPQECGLGKYDIPHDPGDFGRCYRMLKMFPEWRARINEVGEIFPKWKPIIAIWGELESLWETESPTGRCPIMYDRMQSVMDDCMIADGWTRDGKFAWKRK